MKDKLFIGIMGGMVTFATGIQIYNYYLLPSIRHKEIKEMMDKFDHRLKQLEK